MSARIVAELNGVLVVEWLGARFAMRRVRVGPLATYSPTHHEIISEDYALLAAIPEQREAEAQPRADWTRKCEVCGATRIVPATGG